MIFELKIRFISGFLFCSVVEKFAWKDKRVLLIYLVILASFTLIAVLVYWQKETGRYSIAKKQGIKLPKFEWLLEKLFLHLWHKKKMYKP